MSSDRHLEKCRNDRDDVLVITEEGGPSSVAPSSTSDGRRGNWRDDDDDDDDDAYDEIAPAPFDPTEFEEDDIDVTTTSKKGRMIIEEGTNDRDTGGGDDDTIVHPMEFEEDDVGHRVVRRANCFPGSHPSSKGGRAYATSTRGGGGGDSEDHRVDRLEIVNAHDDTRRGEDSIVDRNAAASASAAHGATAVGYLDFHHDIAIPEAFLVEEDDDEYGRKDDGHVIIATPLAKDRPWWDQWRTRLLVCTVSALAMTLAIALGITLGTKSTAPYGMEPHVPKEEGDVTGPIFQVYPDGGGDWSLCSSSSECRNGCCSGEWSGGVLKCTPFDESELLGGYRPDICVGDPPTNGDWAECSTSSECDTGCCSGRYSDGLLKCTPISGERMTDICVTSETNCNGGVSCLVDWEMCTSSSECMNGCCSGEWSGGVLKCTPFDESELLGGYRPDICAGDPPTNGDWAECSTSSECDTGCCSGQYSNGLPKCTPISNKKLANICI